MTPGAGPARLRPGTVPQPLRRARALCTVAALAALFAVALPARAQTEVPESWSLIPADVEVGESFRLLFLTSARRDALPANIGTYNAFVQTRAAAGRQAIRGYSAGFRVVASTANDDANDNTATTYTDEDQGVPIYWLRGTKVADDYADFYDGTWDDEANAKDENGNARATSPSSERPYTGSTHAGEASGNPLGSNPVTVGRPDDGFANDGPIGSSVTSFRTTARPFYALSEVFTVVRVKVSKGWGLTPADVEVGESFRLLFATSATRDASSSGIVDYNSFVQNLAALGHLDIRDYSSLFTVVGSTAGTDALDNTKTTYSNDDKGVPIYWLGGNQVADDYEDFYDGGWNDEANPRNESGGARSLTGVNNYPATGSNHDGTAAGSSSFSTALGSTNMLVTVGRPGSGNALHGPIGSNSSTGSTNARPFYALSGVFEVARFPPVFTSGLFTALRVPENPAPQTDVGAAVSATDPDPGDALQYSLAGADAESFEIDSTSGQIRTREGVTYDHETKPFHHVVVNVTDGTHTVSITVTIIVEDVDEAPAAPAAPGVFAPTGTTGVLSLSWAAPDNTGPAVTDYDVQYRVVGSGSWSLREHAGTDLSATITDLEPGAAYEVQVRATSPEGTGPWSASGHGATGSPPTPVAAEWTLVPAGLVVGDSFRLLFATSTTRDATATDIADYNAFVQTAAAGNGAIRPYGAGFRVVGSTALIDARDNTATAYTAEDRGVPIYWLNGNRVADDYADFYDGFWYDEANATDESGDARSLSGAAEYPFTGSGTDGTEVIVNGLSKALGEPVVRVGRPNSADSFTGPLTSLSELPNTDSRPFYGLSGVFVVAPGITVAPHSDLIPDDFTGDSFRVLFATSATRAATSADIADYNSFVQAAAGAGHHAIRAASSLFTAVASTAAVDARDNTATTYSNDDKGVPIYWLGGNQIADDYEDFYDGDWDDEADPRDESGDARSLTDIADRPFTGSNHDGTAATSGIFSSVLGTTDAVAWVRVGRPGSGNPSHGPISSNSVADKTSERPLYALSPILRVGPQVTVPVDWALKPTGLASGDDFRLLFVTQATRNATATGIGVYNAFVQTRAAAGHEAIQGYASWFRVVGSTGDTDARDNTGTTHTADDKGVPIYWLGGNKVADDYADFYDGSWDDETNPKNESGNARSVSGNASYPFTGSDAQRHGVAEQLSGTSVTRALGRST